MRDCFVFKSKNLHILSNSYTLCSVTVKMMADGEKSHSKSPSLSSKFQRMYKAVSPNNPPWKEAYRKVFVAYPKWLMLYTRLASPVTVCIAKRGRNTRLAWLANPITNPNPNPANPNLPGQLKMGPTWLIFSVF